MRGDSRRDLYAKTLALLGLSVLAGTGALVDYWPTDSPMPTPESALILPALASALPVPNLNVSPAQESIPARRAFAVQAAAFRPSFPVVSFQGLTAEDSSQALANHQMPIESDVLLVSMGQEIALSEPALATAPIGVSAPVMVAAVAGDEPSGFLMGAFKKTGSSLVTIGNIGVRTGAKTGTSIIGAFRAVGGVVRKVL